MRAWRGFTIIELVVVMAIMAILLTVATLSIANSQANARDNERNTDVATIARGLETRYKEGNPVITASPNSYVAPGSYPDVTEMSHILGNTISTLTPTNSPNGAYITTVFPGATTQNFSPPGISGLGGFIIASCPTAGSCPAAYNVADSSPASSSPLSSIVTKNVYYYEPVDANNNVCNATTCVRFNLYWQTEVDAVIHAIRSKHQ